MSVSLDLLVEDLITLSQAARMFPAARGAGRANPATIWRHARQGVLLPDGRRVFLAAAKHGSRWLTSRQAVARFVAELTAAANGDPSPAARCVQQRSDASQDMIEEQLAEHGC
jgi:hypothetical protein